jgi:hypothetical protein
MDPMKVQRYSEIVDITYMIGCKSMEDAENSRIVEFANKCM